MQTKKVFLLPLDCHCPFVQLSLGREKFPKLCVCVCVCLLCNNNDRKNRFSFLKRVKKIRSQDEEEVTALVGGLVLAIIITMGVERIGPLSNIRRTSSLLKKNGWGRRRRTFFPFIYSFIYLLLLFLLDWNEIRWNKKQLEVKRVYKISPTPKKCILAYIQRTEGLRERLASNGTTESADPAALFFI